LNKAARLESILKLNVPRFLTWHVFCIKNGHFLVNFLRKILTHRMVNEDFLARHTEKDIG